MYGCRSLRWIFPWAALSAFALLPAGCEQRQMAPVKTSPTAGGGDHDHGHQHHAHGEKGPHGGGLIAIGGHSAHVEVVVDPGTGKITAWVLDDEAEQPLPIKVAKLEISFAIEHEHEGDEKDDGHDEGLEAGAVTLLAVGAGADGAAQFEGQSDDLKGAEEFHAVLLAIVVGGQKYENIEFDYPEGNEHLDH
ncbi:MAG: hypothetical protein ACT4QC_06755 [Planctomycetaceae bacterium]